eukprot:jgi/Ulvmu1/1033/UM104_0018.1
MRRSPAWSLDIPLYCMWNAAACGGTQLHVDPGQCSCGVPGAAVGPQGLHALPQGTGPRGRWTAHCPLCYTVIDLGLSSAKATGQIQARRKQTDRHGVGPTVSTAH